MALKISRKTTYGVNAEYWKVTETNINWHEKQATIILSGFANEKVRLDGAFPITKQTFGWIGADFPFTFDGKTVEETYEKIKKSQLDADGNELNVWAKAEDC